MFLVEERGFTLMDPELTLKTIIASAKRLAETDPHDESVSATIQGLEKNVSLLNELATKEPANSWGKKSMKDDVDFIGQQIDKLRAAAMVPAGNYRRVVSILSSLKQAHQIASRPQNRAALPKLGEIVHKVAGVFAQVDTIEDLNKPLEAIEKAVHGLYGDQSKNSTFYFDRRGKGHHSDSSKE